MDYYRDTITEKSWQTLQDLARSHRFVLIGGWAVWVYTKRLKSKDIDLVIAFDELETLREAYTFSKNDRLKKYEARRGEIHIDIYVPFWSDLGISAEFILEEANIVEGFRVPPPEILLITKQVAYRARAGSAKGRKDLIDIVSLAGLQQFDWKRYVDIVKRNNSSWCSELRELLKNQIEVPEINLNRHQFSKLKKSWLSQFKDA